MQINGKQRHVLQWHITHACNLRCKHCYQDDYSHFTSVERLYEILDKYTDFVHKNNFYGQINLTGGEPLLHPEFFSLAKEIKRRGFRLGILTNGTLIDAQAAEKIRSLHPIFVQISLDGTRRQHDFIRGPGSFDRALHAIRLLKSRNIRVLVSFTAQKNNLGSFKRLARICAHYGVDKLWWDRVVTNSSEEYAALALSTKKFRTFLTRSLRMEAKYRRPDGSSMISNQRSLQFLGCNSSQDGYICSAGKTLVAVLADGTVMPCRRLSITIGNIHESDFQHLLRSSGFLRYIQDNPYPDACADCKHLLRCMGGAKCITYGQTGTLNAADPNCFGKQPIAANCSVLKTPLN